MPGLGDEFKDPKILDFPSPKDSGRNKTSDTMKKVLDFPYKLSSETLSKDVLDAIKEGKPVIRDELQEEILLSPEERSQRSLNLETESKRDYFISLINSLEETIKNGETDLKKAIDKTNLQPLGVLDALLDTKKLSKEEFQLGKDIFEHKGIESVSVAQELALGFLRDHYAELLDQAEARDWSKGDPFNSKNISERFIDNLINPKTGKKDIDYALSKAKLTSGLSTRGVLDALIDNKVFVGEYSTKADDTLVRSYLSGSEEKIKEFLKSYFERLSEVKLFEYTFYQQFQGLDIDKALAKTELTPYGLLNRLCDTQDLNGVLGQFARILRNEKYPNDIVQQEVARDFLDLYYIKSNKHDTIPTETILKEYKNLGTFEEKLYSSIAETFKNYLENNKTYHFPVDSALKGTKFKAYDVLKSLAMTKQFEGENAALAIILLRENSYNSYPKNMEDFLETHYFSKELSQPLKEKLDKELPKLINEISELFPSRTEPRLSLGENKRTSHSTSTLKIESPYHIIEQFINSEDFTEKLEILKSLDK